MGNEEQDPDNLREQQSRIGTDTNHDTSYRRHFTASRKREAPSNAETKEKSTKDTTAKDITSKTAAAREAAEASDTSDKTVFEDMIDVSYQCVICASVFQMEATLLKHIELNHYIEASLAMYYAIIIRTYILNLKCPYCRTVTLSVKAYNAHIRQQHNNLYRKIICNSDAIVARDSEESDTSDGSVVEETIDMCNQCIICACVFHMETTLSEHLELNHNVKGSVAIDFIMTTPTYSLNLTCPYCGAETLSVKAYNAHIRKQHNNLYRKMVSNTNDTRVKDAAAKEADEGLRNTSDESFNEESASESLSTSDESDKSDVKEPVVMGYQCSICASIFKLEISLLKHLQLHHGINGWRAVRFIISAPTNNFVCPHCGVNASSLKYRNAHIKKYHYKLCFKKVRKQKTKG